MTAGNPDPEALAARLAALPAGDQDRLQRIVMRMRNGSKRVERLGLMFDAGQISARTFLDQAGK